ncbi:hypothetical protein [uncultured Tateyamaria sp.]|nr:hypothetical protein [uncultured Tateyamaria sp.]
MRVAAFADAILERQAASAQDFGAQAIDADAVQQASELIANASDI